MQRDLEAQFGRKVYKNNLVNSQVHQSINYKKLKAIAETGGGIGR